MVAGNWVLNLTVKIALIILQGKYCNEFSLGFNHVLILRTNIKIACHLKKYISSSPKVNSGGMVRGGKERRNGYFGNRLGQVSMLLDTQ